MNYIDTSYVVPLINVGKSSDPGYRNLALIILTRIAGNYPQRIQSQIVKFALESIVYGEEYAVELSEACLNSVEVENLKTALKAEVLNTSSTLNTRITALKILVRRHSPDAALFILNNIYKLPAGIKATVFLDSLDPYDIVYARKNLYNMSLPPDIEIYVKTTEAKLKAKRGISFIKQYAPELSYGTTEIELHNEAPVDLYLDLTSESQGHTYNMKFPTKSFRNVSFRSDAYFYKAYAKEVYIVGTSGYKQFDGQSVYTWIFFLEDQLNEMKRKYPLFNFNRNN